MSRRPRLLPIVIGAASGLLFLKVISGLAGGEGVLSGQAPAAAQEEQAPSTPPALERPDPGKIYHSATERREEADGPTYSDGTVPESDAEAAILERLAERRKHLDKYEAELGERENLLAAAEKRVEERIGELRAIEERINATAKARDEEEKARFEGLIKMYEAMKPKDAARIFEKLGMPVLLDVVERMREAKTAPIMASMDPEKAEELTSAIAQRRALAKVGPQDTVPTAVPPAAQTARPVPTGAR